MVVLLDLKMPKVDGMEVLRQMKSDPDLKHIPVVMLTSSREERDLVQSYKLGANAYVVKPVDFQQFIESIKQLGCFWAIINELPAAAEAVGLTRLKLDLAGWVEFPPYSFRLKIRREDYNP